VIRYVYVFSIGLVLYTPPDTWYLTPDTWYAITWYWIFDKYTWYVTLDTWHAITWYWYTWPDVVIPNWILLHLTPVLHCLFMIITFTATWHDYYTATIWYSWTHVFLNSCILEPLKQGDSWCYTPDTILLLITVIGYSWILNYCEHTVDIIIGQSIIKYSTHTGMEKLMGINIASCL